jgi:hypothetical protein
MNNTLTIDDVYRLLEKKQFSKEQFYQWLNTIPKEKITPYHR